MPAVQAFFLCKPRHILTLVFIKWCLQSHLSTEDYDNARKGLQRTRKFRLYTYYIRYPAIKLVLFINSLRDIIFRSYSRQKTLVWTKDSKFSPAIRPQQGLQQASIELPTFGTSSSLGFDFDRVKRESASSNGDGETPLMGVGHLSPPRNVYSPSERSGRSYSIGSAGGQSLQEGEFSPIGSPTERLDFSST